MPAELVYEMGYRAGEFGDVLCGPFSGNRSNFASEAMASNHWRVRHKTSGFSVDIQVSEQADRQLGLFRLPVLKVCFRTEDEHAGASDEFFHRFHQYFHKGGG